MPEASTLGSLIRERRLEKGFSLGQLATKLGHTAASVRRWERGEDLPEPALVDKIAEVLDLEPGRLNALRAKTTVADAPAAKASEPKRAADSADDGTPSEPSDEGTLAAKTDTQGAAPDDDVDRQPEATIVEAAEDPARDHEPAAPASKSRALPWEDTHKDLEAEQAEQAEQVAEPAEAAPPLAITASPLPATSVLPAAVASPTPTAALAPPDPADPEPTADPGPTKVIAQSRPAELVDAPTEAVPVVAPPPTTPPAGAPATASTDPTRAALARPAFQNPFQAMFDPDSKWLYWIRAGLLFIVSVVLLYTFIWALGELWDSLGELLDTIGSTEEVSDVQTGIEGTTDDGIGGGSDN